MATKVGIDLSIRSPGVVVHLPKAKEFHAYFIPTRKRDSKVRFDGRMSNGASFHVRPLCETGGVLTLGDASRFDFITSLIVKCILRHEKDLGGVDVFMEGHAYGATTAGSARLIELAGVLKHKLHLRGFNVRVIAPTRVKKLFAGSGKAKKVDMYRTFEALGFPKLLTAFGFALKKERIPNPVQDIVDAVALVRVGAFMQAVRKRKRENGV